jgi:hypothetical protein
MLKFCFWHLILCFRGFCQDIRIKNGCTLLEATALPKQKNMQLYMKNCSGKYTKDLDFGLAIEKLSD